MDIERKNFKKLNTESDDLFFVNDLDDNTLVLVENEVDTKFEASDKQTDFEIINDKLIIQKENNQNGDLSKANSETLESINISAVTEVDWKREAMIGNFMPATVKLHRQEININDVIDTNTESRLIHLAVSYSFLNVTRCFVEIFGCDINAKNAYGQTALHLVCNNPSKDTFLFSFLIKNDNILLDEADNSGFPPLFYAVMNNFNIAILALAKLKCDLSHVDNMGNNAVYHSIISGNKFAFNFFMRHVDKSNVNESFYKGEAFLSDVLVTSRMSCIVKHLVKYYHDEIDLKTIESCRKALEQFPHYNKFNYDLLNTLYYYKTRSIFGLLRALFRNDLKTTINNYNSNITACHSYTFKFYNLKTFLVDLLLKEANRYIKYTAITFYLIFMLNIVFRLNMFILSNLNQPDTNTLSIFNLFNLCLYFAFAIAFYLVFKFFLNKHEDKFYDESQYNLTNPLYSTDHVAHQIYEAFERNPLDLFFEEEICEVCLTKKAKSTNHCHICKKCVPNFYFHSKLLGLCFSRRNVYSYLLHLISLLFIHFGIIYFIWLSLDYDIVKNFPQNEYISENSYGIKTIFSSNYFSTNLITFLFNVSFLRLLIVFLLFLTGVLYFQTIFSLIMCIGYNVTYYNMFRYHKKSLGEIRARNNLFYNIPHPNLVSISQFIKNLFTRN